MSRAGDRVWRVGVIAGAVALTLCLFSGVPSAFASPSIDASPVVTVAGSQFEGTVTISGVSVSRLDTDTLDALLSAIQSSKLPTVAVAPSSDEVGLRQFSIAADLLVVLALCTLVGLKVGGR